MRILQVSTCVALMLAFLVGCDSAPGITASSGTPPVVSDLSYSPEGVALNATSGTGPVAVNVALAARVTANGAPIDVVKYVVLPPTSEFEPIKQGTLIRQTGDRFTATADLMIPRDIPGIYTIRIYAIDEEGALSNQLVGSLNVQSTGSAPFITSVTADPPVVVPPATLSIMAAVGDPEGLGNIASVTISITTSAGQVLTYNMFDDGRSQGDLTAGDGIYTARFDVPSANVTSQTFRVQATDRTGLRSEVKSITVNIQ